MKEQEKKYPSKTEIKNLRVLKIIFPIVVTTIAVSYTHLDVYKRQTVLGTKFLIDQQGKKMTVNCEEGSV